MTSKNIFTYMMKKGSSNVVQMSQQCENAFLLFVIPDLK